mgnify:FL=1
MTSKSKKSKLERELAEFRDSNFSHNSAEEFLRFKGDSPDNYTTIYLSAAYVEARDADKKIYETELKLAQTAREKGCRYVTNMDYCGPCIAATGLKPK